MIDRVESPTGNAHVLGNLAKQSRLAINDSLSRPSLRQPVEYGQYTSGDSLAAYGMLASMSRKGDCYDNAVAESFFATLEFELLRPSDWQTREDARQAIFRYIEGWYNPRRRHSTLGYVSPAAYEEQLREAA